MNKVTLWQEKLTSSRAVLQGLLNNLTAEQWQQPVYREGQNWTARDIVAHLVDSERGMSIHIHKIRKGQPTIPDNFVLADWNAGLKSRMADVSLEELQAQLQTVRARLLQGLETLSEDEWQLTGRHPSRGVITIEQYYETIAGHEVQHANDIKTILGI